MLKKDRINPWMKGIVTQDVNRGRTRFSRGEELLVRYVPPRRIDGEMVRVGGYRSVVQYTDRDGKMQVGVRFLHLHEVDAECFDGSKTFKAVNFSTAAE